MASDGAQNKGRWETVSRLWRRFRLVAIPGAIGFAAALIFSGGMASFVQHTETLGFCISCHEMRSTVYQEYKQSAHFYSRSGVHPICADCHVPHGNWLGTIVHKAHATKELFGHFMGVVNTTEKFEAKRLEMAEHVWTRMKASDSAACRNCHNVENWDLSLQKPRSRGEHEGMAERGETCIDCHKGIAHKKPEQEMEELDDPFSLEDDEEENPFELQ